MISEFISSPDILCSNRELAGWRAKKLPAIMGRVSIPLLFKYLHISSLEKSYYFLLQKGNPKWEFF